jgi:hypothetical protein
MIEGWAGSLVSEGGGAAGESWTTGWLIGHGEGRGRLES